MKTRELALTWNASLARVARFALLVALAVALPNLGLPQSVTGPLVNALLLLTVSWEGVGAAALLGILTPLGAALRGVLPLPLLAMIPVIALGNGVFVAIYGGLRARSRWWALGVAAVAKTALLYGAVTLLVARPLQLALGGNPLAITLPEAMVNMMRWPQLATALAGGLIAFGIERASQRR